LVPSLANPDAPLPFDTNMPVVHTADSNDDLYKAVRVSHLNIANILCLQDQWIETLDKKWSAVLQALAWKQSQEIAKCVEQVQRDAAKQVERVQRNAAKQAERVQQDAAEWAEWVQCNAAK
jgi:hypothetical protein